MRNRLAVIGILVQNRELTSEKVNHILSEYANIIVGRMGIPYKERNVSIISIIVDGTTDDIGALTGKLGSIEGVKVKSAITI
ncbi:CopG family transcriptional regulator [Thermoanaerobacterium thermosaccharolyticum]|uniref:CopG family transcriptional regulator n=1 Tax=Thermoanaerobacterium thermosaccharolyticum TaxID=1517 RepID=A0A231VEC5_THETR|nr:TM1266 family iron-only hydrogenase system putative regulator [Thermoanaerobacterium thermosaccharolyticum]OXT06371.1 CopG family transcriptional regulator [Thermoanaerobacterium thermosaccharolyticum]